LKENIMHWLDPDYLPITTGVIERFTINLNGDVDGLLLADETLVHTPPHLSDQLTAAVRPGDAVRVRGVKPRGADLIAAVSVERLGGLIVIDDGPEALEDDGRSEKRAGTKRVPMNVSGTVRLTLFAPKGQIRGALLHDGTMLRLGHTEANRYANQLRPGSQISARGEGLETEYGRVIEVQEIGRPDGGLEPVKKPKQDGAKASDPDTAEIAA
jgi:hypothetical protein